MRYGHDMIELQRAREEAALLGLDLFADNLRHLTDAASSFKRDLLDAATTLLAHRVDEAESSQKKNWSPALLLAQPSTVGRIVASVIYTSLVEATEPEVNERDLLNRLAQSYQWYLLNDIEGVNGRLLQRMNGLGFDAKKRQGWLDTLSPFLEEQSTGKAGTAVATALFAGLLEDPAVSEWLTWNHQPKQPIQISLKTERFPNGLPTTTLTNTFMVCPPRDWGLQGGRWSGGYLQRKLPLYPMLSWRRHHFDPSPQAISAINTLQSVPSRRWQSFSIRPRPALS